MSIALLLAVGAFLAPQEIPLVWFPLQKENDENLYLEITCSAEGSGDVEIAQNLSTGFNDIDKIRFPISVTNQPISYTFPLSDAPLTELRLNPPINGVSLLIEKMRIIDRRDTEIRRFTADMFFPNDGIDSIVPEKEGWRITSKANGQYPQCRIELYTPILAKDFTPRNTVRCILSTGYLATLLLIIILAFIFTFSRPRSRNSVFRTLGYATALAIMFAAVGNRGLIKNSWHYAKYDATPIPDEIRLELDLVSTSPTGSQLFWDSGNGYRESDSDMINLTPHHGLQTARFRLPKTEIHALRFDPRHNGGSIEIQGIRVVDWGNRTHALLPLDSLRAGQQIESLEATAQLLHITTTPDTDDPTTEFTPEAVAQINAAIAARLTRFDY